MSVNYSEIASKVTDVLKDVVYVTDVDSCDIHYINEAAAELFGVDISDTSSWNGHKCYNIIQKRDKQCEFCTNKIIREDSYHSWEHYYEPKDMYFLVQDRLIRVADTKLRLCVMNDITHQRKLEAELRDRLQQEKTLNACIEHLHTNRAPREIMFDLLGVVGEYFEADNVHIVKIDNVENNYKALYEWYRSKEYQRNFGSLIFSAEELHDWKVGFETHGYYHVSSDGTPNILFPKQSIKHVLSELFAVPWKNDSGEFSGFIGLENPKLSLSDISFFNSLTSIISDFLMKIELHDSLRSLSFTDPMSGLGNRGNYRLKVDQLENQNLKSLGVLYLDINGLKQLNDEYGQLYGDKTIERVASILFKTFGMSAFRISGDDFVVLCPDVEEEAFVRDIEQVRSDIISTGISVCIGSSFANSSINIHKQIEIADGFMYTEKQQLFTSSQINQKYRSSLSDNLAQEIDNNMFSVYLQPQIELSTGNLIGAEALIRKFDSDGKMLSPLSFIPFYEQQEIIHFIDLYVLETICKQFAEWDRIAPGNNIKVATNFSRITLKETNIVTTVRAICERYNVPTHRIVIEITESLEVFERKHLCNLIIEFTRYGFPVSLDDFGSGHSNLSVLTSSDFDEVKIDKSIVDDIVCNNKSLAIAQLVVNMCRSFNIEHSVAEGIEYTEQYNLLKSLNCTIGQGYFFDKPLPIPEFTDKYFNHTDIKSHIVKG